MQLVAGPAGVDARYGLDAEQVSRRREQGLANVTPPSPARSIGQILRANVFTRFNAILGSLFVVAMIVGPPQDALFGVVLVVNTAIGVLQELRAKATLDRLRILNAPVAHVVRSGTVEELAPQQIVLDDVLELRAGDQVVVDGVVLEAAELEVDESLLTGEPAAVAKTCGARVLSGSLVVSGSARVRATDVGASAYAAGLEAKARHFSLVRSELQQGTNSILRMVTWVMVPAAAALVSTQTLRSHQSLDDALRGSVAGVAAMVPEGLVLLTSIAFAVGALRLARHRVLVQELPAVEGLSRVDTLCIDKTGTLTEPGMRLSELVPLGDASAEAIRKILAELAEADPAPNATLRALAPEGGAGGGRIESQVPFSSARKWSAVRFAGGPTWVLGAPEVVAPGDARLESEVALRQVSARRVLVLGSTAADLAGATLPLDIAPVALLALEEPLRRDAAKTIGYLVDQGIRINVLSGDAPATVAAVAERVGIARAGEPVDASALEDDESLAEALSKANVFGRVRPEQKLAAVRSLQAEGHVVAMVGDGVNDVQALKEAALGIAMGSGSQSTRSVARVVLLDSAFASVPQILAEGRRVVANIERVARLFVTKTAYAAVLAVVVAVTAVPFPFFPRHLTVVSTLTIGVPGFFLALAAGAPRAEGGFVGRVLAFAVPAGVAAATATYGVYALARASSDSGTQARTAAMLALFAFATWVLVLVARPLDTRRVTLVGAMAGGLAVPFVSAWSRGVFGLALPSVAVLGAGAVAVAGAALAFTGWQQWVAPRISRKWQRTEVREVHRG